MAERPPVMPAQKRRGRPTGSKDKRPRRALARIYADRYKLSPGELPLDYMLRVMRDPRQPQERRDMMAIKAAPFCHATFSALKVGGNKIRIEQLLAELATDELAAFARVVEVLTRLSERASA